MIDTYDPEALAIKQAGIDAGESGFVTSVRVGNMNRERINRAEWVEFEGYMYVTVDGGKHFFAGCRRCGGSGHYSHNGTHSRCYECDDNATAKLGNFIGDRAATEKHAHGRAVARQRRIDKAEAKRMVEVNRLAEKVALLTAKAPDVAAFLLNVDLNEFNSEADWYAGTNANPNYEKNPFIRSMAEQVLFVVNAKRDFTDNMIAAVRKFLAARAEQEANKANATPVVEGRIEIKGKVVSTKSGESDYGTWYKMLVEDERGFRVYGTIPNNLWNEVELLGAYRKNAWGETAGVMEKLVGMEVKFVATVEASDKDKSFGFFKRPTKAEVVA